MEVGDLMRKVPAAKLTTINDICNALAEKHKATIGCPMTTGLFAWVAAHATKEQEQRGTKNITLTGAP